MRATKATVTFTDGKPVVEFDGEVDYHVVDSMMDAWEQAYYVELKAYCLGVREAKAAGGQTTGR